MINQIKQARTLTGCGLFGCKHSAYEPINEPIQIMMTTQTFEDKNYFIVLSTKKDGTVNRDGFIFERDACVFHDKLWHKREDEFKRIEILEVLQTTK